MVRRAFTRPAFWAGLALFAAGMAAGAVWDLPLDHALYSPASLPAILMEAFGYYPLYLPAAGLALCAAADQRIAPPWRVLCGAAALAGCAALAAHSFSVLRRRGAPVPMLFTCAVWLVLAVGGALALRYACVSAARLGRLRFACFWGTVYFIVELAVIGLLKLVWARTRFDDILAAGDFSLAAALWAGRHQLSIRPHRLGLRHFRPADCVRCIGALCPAARFNLGGVLGLCGRHGPQPHGDGAALPQRHGDGRRGDGPAVCGPDAHGRLPQKPCGHAGPDGRPARRRCIIRPPGNSKGGAWEYPCAAFIVSAHNFLCHLQAEIILNLAAKCPCACDTVHIAPRHGRRLEMPRRGGGHL